MARAFARIAFTPNVRAAQTRMGSREAYRRAEIGAPENPALGPMEIAFIMERDSFYQGTVGENGWPYVQHRGGPVGFLKVLDELSLGYADFSGNRQYISVGNLAGDDRVCLFLMDYLHQQRLKIWGRARIVDKATEPELIARLESPNYWAHVERGVVIRVEAFDWNCPKYITPRYSEAEVEALLVAARRQTPVFAPAEADSEEAIGQGALALTVTGVRRLTPRVRAYELRATDGGDLPSFDAGSHLVVPVRLLDGSLAARQYSLTSHPDRRDAYEIAVLREDDGGGGSRAIHASWGIGTRINVDAPINHFPLHADHRPAVLIAGGIGITPIKAMANALKARGTLFELHYTGRTPGEMVYRQHLASKFPTRSHFYFSRASGHARLDVPSVLRNAPTDALFYICGPTALIETVIQTASELRIDSERVRFESFY